jgi:hypothetical protein
MAKKKITKFSPSDRAKPLAPEPEAEVQIPDDAIRYIVSHYLQHKSVPGVPVVVGISIQTVEDILQLLIDWAAVSGNIEDGVVKIGVVD